VLFLLPDGTGFIREVCLDCPECYDEWIIVSYQSGTDADRTCSFPGSGFFKSSPWAGKITSPLMLHDLKAGTQSAAAKIVSDVMESCRNEGSIVLSMDRHQPREILSGEI
jgi:hypothetical protein